MVAIEPTADVLASKKPRKDKKSKEKGVQVDNAVGGEPSSNGVGEHTQKEKKKKDKDRKRKREDTDAAMIIDEPALKRRKQSSVDDEHDAGEVDVPEQTSGGAIGKQKAKKEKKKKEKGQANGINNGSTSSPQQIASFLSENNITIHGDVTPVLSFDELELEGGLRGVLSAFKAPTPIQACAWPALLKGKDVVGIAETGSGKTLAFGLPALVRLSKQRAKGPDVQVLVVAPTRELAIQTHDTLAAAGEPLGIKSVCLYGGVGKDEQKKLLKSKKLRIIVGTPGRLLDLANEGACDLSRVSYLVLDEADRMLDRGFENDIRRIIGMTAQGEGERQTLMFSATWPDSVRKLASTFLKDAVRITVGQDDLSANRKVEQVIDVFDEARLKDGKLLALLKGSQAKKSGTPSEESRTLIFVLYKAEAPRVDALLKRQGYNVGQIHGDMTQQARISSLEDFKSGKVGILIATDVAARGLDIPNVGLVINYTFPLTVEDYVHRIGRTGRGGRTGKSVTFFTGDNHEKGLAGELMKVVRESGHEASAEGLRKFPMTVKKREHGSYGAHFKDVDMSITGKKIVF